MNTIFFVIFLYFLAHGGYEKLFKWVQELSKDLEVQENKKNKNSYDLKPELKQIKEKIEAFQKEKKKADYANFKEIKPIVKKKADEKEKPEVNKKSMFKDEVPDTDSSDIEEILKSQKDLEVKDLEDLEDIANVEHENKRKTNKIALSDLQKAIIMKEILDKPVFLRK